MIIGFTVTGYTCLLIDKANYQGGQLGSWIMTKLRKLSNRGQIHPEPQPDDLQIEEEPTNNESTAEIVELASMSIQFIIMVSRWILGKLFVDTTTRYLIYMIPEATIPIK